MIWSQDELIELTGYKQKSKIANWLKANGFAFYLGRDGWPRVLRNVGVVTPKTLKKSEPNLAALMERQNGKTSKIKK